jgi:hypothetical protein
MYGNTAIKETNYYKVNMENKYRIQLKKNIILIIENINNIFAHVSFVDQNNKIIEIPHSFYIYDVTHDCFMEKKQNKMCILLWTHIYDFEFDKIHLFQFDNKHLFKNQFKTVELLG